MILSINQLSICWVVSFAGWYLYEHDLACKGATGESSSSLWWQYPMNLSLEKQPFVIIHDTPVIPKRLH